MLAFNNRQDLGCKSLENPIGIETAPISFLRATDIFRCKSLENPIGIETDDPYSDHGDDYVASH